MDRSQAARCCAALVKRLVFLLAQRMCEWPINMTLTNRTVTILLGLFRILLKLSFNTLT